MQLIVNTSQEAIKDSTGVNFINDNGIFPVQIKFISIKTNESGSQSLDINLLYNNEPQTIYGVTIRNTDGAVNNIGMSLINKLSVIAGIPHGTALTIADQTHAVGKEQKNQTFKVITNFSGLKCQMRFQMEYSKYQGKINERPRIRNVFSAKGFTANEIASGVTEPKQMEIEREKYANQSNFDGVTEAEVAAWIAGGRNRNNQAATQAVASTATPAFDFGD